MELVSISGPDIMKYMISELIAKLQLFLDSQPDFQARNIEDIFYVQHFQVIEYGFSGIIKLFVIYLGPFFFSLKVLFHSNSKIVPKCR